MACCRIVPNHCLNQCCLTVNKILLQSSQGNIYDINPQVVSEIYTLKSLQYFSRANGLRAFVLCIITGLVKCVDVPLVVVLQLDDFVAITKLSVLCYDNFNSFWPSDAIWRHRSGSTLTQAMACCLMAPSHYLNQCWLFISDVHWHLSEGIFIIDTSAINYWN